MMLQDLVRQRREKGSRWDPRTQVFVLFCFSILAITLDRPVSLLLLSLFSVAGYILVRPPIRIVRYVVALLAVGAWGIMIGQAIFYAQLPRTVLLSLVSPETPVLGTLTGGVYLYREGFYYGAVQSLRFIATVSMGLLIGFTTDPRILLTGLMSLRVPYPLAFMVTMALRYAPTVTQEGQEVFQSQRLRGARIWNWNPIKTMNALINLFKPILIRNVRRAGMISDCIQCRGFSPKPNRLDWKRSALYPIRMKIQDYFVVFCATGLTLTCVFAKLVYALYVKGIYYDTWLRPIYDLARRWI